MTETIKAEKCKSCNFKFIKIKILATRNWADYSDDEDSEISTSNSLNLQ